MWFRTIAKMLRKEFAMAGLFVSIRVDFLIGRWWTGDFSPNLHWWKVTISMPGRSSRAWTRGIFHELAPVGCSNANTPLIPSRYSITKRAKLKRRFASRHLRLKRETEASRFQAVVRLRRVYADYHYITKPEFQTKAQDPWALVCCILYYLYCCLISTGTQKCKNRQQGIKTEVTTENQNSQLLET